jgi:hypothetical protein
VICGNNNFLCIRCILIWLLKNIQNINENLEFVQTYSISSGISIACVTGLVLFLIKTLFFMRAHLESIYFYVKAPTTVEKFVRSQLA